MEIIDLGLSVKWASCNIGATVPEECGNYYSWGEIIFKNIYNEYTYTLSKFVSNNNLSLRFKYFKKYNIVDKKYKLDLTDDVANIELGKNWHIPTTKEWKELYENCTWKWIPKSDKIAGMIITSNINKNSIFLPAAGYGFFDRIQVKNMCGHYWSNRLEGISQNAQFMFFNTFGKEITSGVRQYGRSIRPVIK